MTLLNILRFFGFKRGCLHGKTKEQKEKFFFLLYEMASVDKGFFRHQCRDLLPSELAEFELYVKERKAILECINLTLEVLLRFSVKK